MQNLGMPESELLLVTPINVTIGIVKKNF